MRREGANHAGPTVPLPRMWLGTPHEPARACGKPSPLLKLSDRVHGRRDTTAISRRRGGPRTVTPAEECSAFCHSQSTDPECWKVPRDCRAPSHSSEAGSSAGRLFTGTEQTRPTASRIGASRRSIRGDELSWYQALEIPLTHVPSECRGDHCGCRPRCLLDSCGCVPGRTICGRESTPRSRKRIEGQPGTLDASAAAGQGAGLRRPSDH